MRNSWCCVFCFTIIGLLVAIACPGLEFDSYPKVVAADGRATVTIEAKEALPVLEAEKWRIGYVRGDGFDSQDRYMGYNEYEFVPFETTNSAFKVSLPFAGEGEHALRLERLDGGEWKHIHTARVYSLKPDLLKLRPFKGDMHFHTTYSDGNESPAVVAAANRQIGMDYLVITDHRKMEPSLEAIDVLKTYPTQMRCFPGEEIHPPGTDIHMVNFGGSVSASAWMRDRYPEYEAELREIEKTLPAELNLNATEAFWVAAGETIARKVRSGGGLAIYAHPYWRHHDRIYTPEAFLDAMIARGSFDAYELIGGYEYEGLEDNVLSVARYHDLREQGKRFGIVGVTDTHSIHVAPFGWNYTIVWANSPDLEEVIAGIRAGNSVAVEAVKGEVPRAHGPFRLVRYAHFLMREYFPIHDEWCRREGNVWMEALSGTRKVPQEELLAAQAPIEELLTRYFPMPESR